MYNQLKSEFLKLKYSKLFIAVPILFLAGLILYGSFSLSAGGTQLFVSEGDEETSGPSNKGWRHRRVLPDVFHRGSNSRFSYRHLSAKCHAGAV